MRSERGEKAVFGVVLDLPDVQQKALGAGLDGRRRLHRRNRECEVCQKLADFEISPVRLLVQHPLDDIRDGRGNLRVDGSYWLRCLHCGRAPSIDEAECVEGLHVGQESVGKRADDELITTPVAVDGGRANLLRAHPSRRSGGWQRGVRLIVYVTSQPQVDDNRPAVSVEDDVVRAQVSMRCALGPDRRGRIG